MCVCVCVCLIYHLVCVCVCVYVCLIYHLYPEIQVLVFPKSSQVVQVRRPSRHSARPWVHRSAATHAPSSVVREKTSLRIPTAGLPWGLYGKNPPANTGDAGEAALIPGLRRSPGEGDVPLRPVFSPGKSYGQNSLTGYSP